MKEEFGASYISKEDILVKTQDGSPLDFSGSDIWSTHFLREESEHWIRFGNLFKRSGQRSISI